MHRRILGAAARATARGVLGAVAAVVPALALGAPAPARDAMRCTAPTRAVERFIDARCEACWARAEAALPASTWALDWIVPATDAPDAPLALAALPEARERIAELGRTPDAERAARADWTIAPGRASARIAVEAGPAWNGYLGLQLRMRGPVPAGAQAYLALVEELPPDSEGNPLARNLVRSVVGPIPLSPTEPTRELRALRLPENAKPERLRATAWWLDGERRLRGIAREGCVN